MKKFTNSLLFALFLLGAFAFTKSDKWYQFKSKPFGFKIDFPEKPTEQTRTVNTEAGEGKLTIYMFDASKAKADDNLVYMIVCGENPDSTINSDNKDLSGYFKKSVEGAVNGVHGKLLVETVISLDGFPGREIRVDFKDGLAVIKMRMYLIHNKLYMLETITETSQDFNKSINKFMDSFKLIK